MFRFVFSKIWNKKWMVLSLFLGNLLMVAIAAAGPMYSRASLQRALTKNLGTYLEETGFDPGTIQIRGSYRPSGNLDNKKFTNIMQAGEELNQMVAELGVPVIHNVAHFYNTDIGAVRGMTDTYAGTKMYLKMSAYSDVEDHIQIVTGEMYSKEPDGNVLEVIVNEKTYIEKKLILGQEIVATSLKDANGEYYKIRVVGIFENSQSQDSYWLSSPADWGQDCLIDYDLFVELFLDPERMDTAFYAEWYSILDYTAIRGDQAERYLEVLDENKEVFSELGMIVNQAHFQPTLEAYELEAKKLNETIQVLQLPIFVLLAVFIFMVSRQMLEMEQNEISIYKSRGANKRQIVLIYFTQSVYIAILSLVGGIPLGMLICMILGASNAFLEFVQRAALPLEISMNVLLTALIAAGFSVCTMVLPVFKFANIDIVEHKRQKNRKKKFSWWQLAGVDVILLGISVYGLYQYNNQREILAQRVLEGASLDPILYICSPLFMIGAALLVLRVFPWIVRIVFLLGKRWWTPSLYTSFLRIVRTKSNQGFLIVFLIMTLAMGIYNAQSARTINANAQEKIQYTAGADIVLQEVWEREDADSEVTYTEPDFDKYLSLDGASHVTKVLVNENTSVSMSGSKLKGVKLMGIHTKEFGETAWFKESLLPLHYHDYLNAISQNAQAVLVSTNFKTLYGYEVGDIINYSVSSNEEIRGIIYGFIDYWPTYVSLTISKDKGGNYVETDKFLIVAHLSQLQASWGVAPYQVWIDAEESTRFIYDFAEEKGIRFSLFRDASAQLIEQKNDPIFQGTNGILTIGFICILLLCTIGFLIYWILSIQSRTLQFGIFRAMGMSMREIITMLLNEQLFITGVSIGMGILIGMLTSKLFVPLIQIAYSSADQVLPLEIVSEASDYVRLFTMIGVVILICMFILGWLISKIKISQALKLGED